MPKDSTAGDTGNADDTGDNAVDIAALQKQYPLGSEWTPGPDDGQCLVWKVVGYGENPCRSTLALRGFLVVRY